MNNCPEEMHDPKCPLHSTRCAEPKSTDETQGRLPKMLHPVRPPSQLTSLGSELCWPLEAHVLGGTGLLSVSDKPLKSSLKAAFLNPLISGSKQQARQPECPVILGPGPVGIGVWFA